MAARAIGYADFETEHQGDIMAATGMSCRIVGHEVHLFEGESDTHRIPESRVKCGGLIVGDDEMMTHSVPEFLLALHDSRAGICYFHNLKFDEYYIAYCIAEAGGVLQLTPTRSVRVKRRSMGYQGQIYSTDLEFLNSNGKHVRNCQLRDSAKIWSMKLEKLGSMFGFPKGHEALRVGCDAELEAYCLQDCRILKAAMEAYFDMVREATGGKRSRFLTAASTAYNLGMDWLTVHEGLSSRAVAAMFPPCDQDHGFPPWLRLGYKGATPLIDEAVRMIVIMLISVFDINSDYPFMMSEKKLPMGRPVVMSDLSSDNVWTLYEKGILLIVRARIRAHVKSGHRATFLLKHKNKEGSTLAESLDCDDPEQEPWHVLTSPDMSLLLRDYDIEYIEFLDVLAFDSPHEMVNGERQYVNIFKPFLAHWYDVKNRMKHTPGMEGLVAFAKLIINSFYGKFGTNPVFDGRDYLFEGPDEPLRSVEVEAEVDDEPKYLPFAMFVTAYARDYMSQVCNLIGWQHVAYTDTDSIHVHGMRGQDAKRILEEAGLTCDDHTLGGWDLEEEDVPFGVYIRPKGYVHANEDRSVIKSKTRMAGANDFSGFETIDDFLADGAEVSRNRAYKVVGGILIMNERIAVNGDCMRTRLRHHGHLIDDPEEISRIRLQQIREAAHGI